MENSAKKPGQKPLGGKSYGSIPHLKGSKVGVGDHTIHEGQHRICTEKTRDSHDLVIVQEKYDGSNVCVARIDGQLIPLVREGYTALSSPRIQHHYFDKWVKQHANSFDFIQEGERVCGEWLLQAHGIKYSIFAEPFVAFDIIRGKDRVIYSEFLERAHEFVLPRTLHIGKSISIEDAMGKLNTSRCRWVTANGDKPEGLIYRVERKGRIDFLAKFVRPDFETGKYLESISREPDVWNIEPDWLFDIHTF